MGNLSQDLTEEQVKEVIEGFVGPIVSLELKKGPNQQSRGMQRYICQNLLCLLLPSVGFCFITLADRQTAENARRVLKKKIVHVPPLPLLKASLFINCLPPLVKGLHFISGKRIECFLGRSFIRGSNFLYLLSTPTNQHYLYRIWIKNSWLKSLPFTSVNSWPQ